MHDETAAPIWSNSWIVGARGLHHSLDGSNWQPAGGTGYPIHDLIRESDRILCATHWGLWQVDGNPLRWQQLHDETLTEVLGIAPDPRADGPGVVAVSAYGLAFGRRVEMGATRWQSRDAGLSLNERFSNAVLLHPKMAGHYLVGTEDGVLLYAVEENRWQRSELTGLPCRALLAAHGWLWAATDGAGIWRSVDGLSWQRAGVGLDQDCVFALHATAHGILAGTLHGMCAGDGESTWQRSGPSLLVSAVAAHPKSEGPWLAGANPGGLWRSDDAGESWRQVGDFDTIRTILAPEAA
jgi:hypothetical protein